MLDNIKDSNLYSPSTHTPRFKKSTDVQSTWREHGWTPPGDDPHIRAKWQYFRTLNALMEESNNG